MTSNPTNLQRILGPATAWLLGMGVAIGSGIFRTPGEVASMADSTGWIIGIWILGGLVILVQGMVSSELATRFPEAGGEYVFLREAYGDFAAFFFGWAYTIFIIGGGAAAISLAFGDFGAELLGWNAPVPEDEVEAGGLEHVFATWGAKWLACAALLFVFFANAIGLRTGAGTQNLLTVLKISALVALIVAGFSYAGETSVGVTTTQPAEQPTGAAWLLAALLPALWSYEGTTDSIKLSGEIKDVQRAIPRAVIGSTLSLIGLYVLVNLAFLNVLTPSAMAGKDSVPGEMLAVVAGENGRRAALLIGMLVCLGSLSSTILATVRVTFAMAIDRFAPRVLGQMSKGQAPVAALALVTVFAVGLVLYGNFGQVLEIYFFAAAFLFGLSYGSLLIFRMREKERSEKVFYCPAGPALAILLICFQLVLAGNILASKNAIWMRDVGGLLALITASYFVVRFWRFKSLYG